MCEIFPDARHERRGVWAHNANNLANKWATSVRNRGGAMGGHSGVDVMGGRYGRGLWAGVMGGVVGGDGP